VASRCHGLVDTVYPLTRAVSSPAHCHRTGARIMKARVKLGSGKVLIIDDVPQVDSRGSFRELRVYRGDDLVATLNEGEVSSAYIERRK
jgi:hypothetical protein